MALRDDARLVYLHLDQKDVWHVLRLRRRQIEKPRDYCTLFPREEMQMANKVIVIDPVFNDTWVLKDRWSGRTPYRVEGV